MSGAHWSFKLGHFVRKFHGQFIRLFRIESLEHQLALVMITESDIDFHVNSSWAYESGIQPIDVVGRHKHDSSFCRSYTINGVQQTTQSQSVETLVSSLVLEKETISKGLKIGRSRKLLLDAWDRLY